MSYILSCCSTADLTKERFESCNIRYVPFHFAVDGVEYRRMYLATNKVQGFRPHPIFVREDGTLKNFAYIGRMHASYDTDIHSKPDATIKVNTSQVTFRQYCASKGTKWHLYDMRYRSALDILMHIEIGSFDEQNVIGMGVSSADAQLPVTSAIVDALIDSASGVCGSGWIGIPLDKVADVTGKKVVGLYLYPRNIDNNANNGDMATNGTLTFDEMWVCEDGQMPNLTDAELLYSDATTSSIAVKTQPTKTGYVKNVEAFDAAGGVLTITHPTGHTDEVDLTKDMVSGFDNTTVGPQKLTVTYDGITLTEAIEVEIIDATVTDMVIKTEPTKKEYYGKSAVTALDLTGGVISVSFSTGSTVDIDMTADMISGFDSSKLGDNTLTVTYGPKTATFKITIIPIPSEKLWDIDGITGTEVKPTPQEGNDRGKMTFAYVDDKGVLGSKAFEMKVEKDGDAVKGKGIINGTSTEFWDTKKISGFTKTSRGVTADDILWLWADNEFKTEQYIVAEWIYDNGKAANTGIKADASAFVYTIVPDENGAPTVDCYIGRFEANENGVYITVQMSKQMSGLGTSRYIQYAAERVSQNPVSSETVASWQDICKREMVIFNERYSSTNYDKPFASVFMLDEIPGYIYALNEKGGKTLKITDERNAVSFTTMPCSTNRDLIDAQITKDTMSDETEITEFKLSSGLNYRFVDEFPLFTSEVTEVNLRSDEAQWFKIGDDVAGSTIMAECPDNSVIYIYNKYHEVVYSTHMLNADGLIPLPSEGYIMFAGEDGGEICIH